MKQVKGDVAPKAAEYVPAKSEGVKSALKSIRKQALR
jgi:hypothetical protein